MQNDQEIFANNAAPFNTIKLLSAGDNCRVKRHIVDIAAKKFSKESQLRAKSTKSVTIVKQEECNITSIAMSNDTHTLFVANHKGGITQFQKEDASLHYYLARTFKGHNFDITSISLSNSKMHLLSASWDKTLRVWDLENGTQLACLNERQKNHQYTIQSCCWNGQDTLFASGDSRGGLVVWAPPLSIYNTSNMFIPLCKFKVDKVEGQDLQVYCLKFQENGLDLFASNYMYGASSVIRLWSINEKELVDSKSKLIHQKNATMPLIQQPKRESDKLNGMIESFDVSGSMLLVGVNEEILPLSANSLKSVANSVRFENVHYNHNQITSLVFSKDGKYVALGNDGYVQIFDSKSGKCLKYIKNVHYNYSNQVRAIVFEI